jgi:hypothetical protein
LLADYSDVIDRRRQRYCTPYFHQAWLEGYRDLLRSKGQISKVEVALSLYRGVLNQGRFPFALRFNMDEVGLPFVFDQKMTYDEIGTARVCVAEPGDGAYSKRQATAICCINPLLPPDLQCPVALIFKGED